MNNQFKSIEKMFLSKHKQLLFTFFSLIISFIFMNFYFGNTNILTIAQSIFAGTLSSLVIGVFNFIHHFHMEEINVNMIISKHVDSICIQTGKFIEFYHIYKKNDINVLEEQKKLGKIFEEIIHSLDELYNELYKVTLTNKELVNLKSIKICNYIDRLTTQILIYKKSIEKYDGVYQKELLDKFYNAFFEKINIERKQTIDDYNYINSIKFSEISLNYEFLEEDERRKLVHSTPYNFYSSVEYNFFSETRYLFKPLFQIKDFENKITYDIKYILLKGKS